MIKFGDDVLGAAFYEAHKRCNHNGERLYTDSDHFFDRADIISDLMYIQFKKVIPFAVALTAATNHKGCKNCKGCFSDNIEKDVNRAIKSIFDCFVETNQGVETLGMAETFKVYTEWLSVGYDTKDLYEMFEEKLSKAKIAAN